MKELLLVVCNMVMKESDEKEQVIMKLQQIKTKIIVEDTNIQETEKEGILQTNEKRKEEEITNNKKKNKEKVKSRKDLYVSNNEENSGKYLHYLNWGNRMKTEKYEQNNE